MDSGHGYGGGCGGGESSVCRDGERVRRRRSKGAVGAAARWWGGAGERERRAAELQSVHSSKSGTRKKERIWGFEPDLKIKRA